MYPTKETLSAFIDGELDAAQHAEVAALAESDQKLKTFITEQEQLRAELQAAFAGMVAAPIPERLLATVASTPISFRVRMRRWLGAPERASGGSSLGRIVAPALTMALGLVVGVAIEQSSSSTNDFSTSSSGIVARAGLAQTLNERLVSEQQTGATHVGVTFRDKAGALCRSFDVSRDTSTLDGFACHHGGDWQVGALVSRPVSATNPAYTLAGSSMPNAIRDEITARMKGPPLDAAAERRARDQGWN